ncbi:MAG: site-2 protease family protein [Thermoplasmatales archaeon]|nr:MAG: site-2 protease family protein [Thermoplasmatales archaeon]
MANDWSNFGQINQETTLDIELLKKEVGQRFPFYDVKFDVKTAAFFCRIDEETLEEKFDSLRISLFEKGHIPMLRHEKGEHIIYIIKKIKRKEKSVWINISLLIATIITASLTGSILYMGHFDIWSIPTVMDIFKAENLFNGILLFSFPLMSILFVHEMGHYFISKKHGIRASLPFFMPIPPILPRFNIGTFGALISSRDPMPNKKALFDVGISGPLSGFIVALPVTAIGILNSTPATITEPAPGEIMLGGSLLFTFLSTALLNIPVGTAINLSLTAFAGWVGLLITSINLLPAGQLDGGHIFRAFLGEKQKYAGWIAVFIMIFTGWWFFAIIIVFMMGMMHPPPLNDITKLDTKRKLYFLIALAILVLCYIPYPIYVA